MLTALALGAGAASAQSSLASVTISPLPGSVGALPRTQISFLGAPASELRGVSVVGSLSGHHTGRLRAYSSAPGASYLLAHPFKPGERVSVHATLLLAKGHSVPLSTSFTVAQPVPVTKARFPTTSGTPADEQHFLSAPSLRPPVVSVNLATSVARGYLFAAPFQGPAQWGPMIFDNHGGLVWFRPVPSGEDAADLQVQSYAGQHVLTWWQGHTIVLGYGTGEDVIADSRYHTLAVLKGGNGLRVDEHEFTLTPQGQAFVTAYSPVKADLSSAGGPSSGIALDCAVQEIDVKTGLVMWEWHSLGHVDVSESYSTAPGAEPRTYVRAPESVPYDYFHLNSVDLLGEGNLLISARNTWAVYKVSAHSGAIVWRLGGKRSSFRLGTGVQFAYQHDARMLSPDEVSVFDDEGAPPVNPPSRGEIVHIDYHSKVAALVQSFVRTSGPLSTSSQGNVQLLSGGDRMVGWGGLPNFTEFNRAGGIVFDGQFPTGEMSYRVYRFPWYGQPRTRPAIAAVDGTGAEPACRKPPPGQPACLAIATRLQTTVYMSWDGATTVVSWRVLGGSSAKHLKTLTVVKRAGFETNVAVPPQAYVQAQALDRTGKVLASTSVVGPKAAG